MYRSCIFCTAALGSNDSIEAFPVGRSVAFDSARGRLWAVCPRCARWNLAPIEERWEAIEDAERHFRDARIRAQSENVGLARLRDGTRLIRVGRALPGELAVWRYGQGLLRRRQRNLVVAGTASLAAGVGVVAGLGIGFGLVGMAFVGGMGYLASSFVEDILRKPRNERVIERLAPEETRRGRRVTVRRRHLLGARLVQPPDGSVAVALPALREAGDGPLVVEGAAGRRLLSRAMVQVNAHGARRDWLQTAVERIAAEGTAEGYLHASAAQGRLLLPFGDASIAPEERLALEMAAHEETERRALQGELAALEEMWRQAEILADISDRLPDGDSDEPLRIYPAR
jgi:hypothetical protein